MGEGAGAGTEPPAGLSFFGIGARSSSPVYTLLAAGTDAYVRSQGELHGGRRAAGDARFLYDNECMWAGAAGRGTGGRPCSSSSSELEDD